MNLNSDKYMVNLILLALLCAATQGISSKSDYLPASANEGGNLVSLDTD